MQTMGRPRFLMAADLRDGEPSRPVRKGSHCEKGARTVSWSLRGSLQMAYSFGFAPHPAQLRHNHRQEVGRAAVKELGLLLGSLLYALQTWPHGMSADLQMS